MPTMRIVPTLDELEDGTLRLGTRAECAPLQQLTFEGGEKALRHGIIETVSDAAHRKPHTGWLKPIGGLRKSPFVDREKLDFQFVLTFAAFNLERMRDLGVVPC